MGLRRVERVGQTLAELEDAEGCRREVGRTAAEEVDAGREIESEVADFAGGAAGQEHAAGVVVEFKQGRTLTADGEAVGGERRAWDTIRIAGQFGYVPSPFLEAGG